MHRIVNNKAPEYLRDCLSNFSDNDNNYQLRNRSQFRIPYCRLETYSKSFFPSSLRLWNSLRPEQRTIPSYQTFKQSQTRVNSIVPKYYLIGSRKTNILHTKLRHRCSPLNADLYRVNLSNDPGCECGYPLEDSLHYLLECPRFSVCRNQNIGQLRQIGIEPDIEILLFGSDNMSEESNTTIFKHVHNFILHSNPFDT